MKKQQKIILGILIIGILLLIGNRFYQTLKKDEFINQPLNIQGEVPKFSKESSTLSLLMAGDALYHEGVYKDGLISNGAYSFSKQLELIKPIVKKYDLAYYNQESMLGGTKMGLSTYPRFNSPQEVGDAFLDAGFNLVSTANNHSLDRGKEAILNSYQYWKSKDGVLMSGTCDTSTCLESIPIGEKNNISYAFLSYTTSLNGLVVPKDSPYLVNVYSEERVKSDIEKIKDRVDIILVAMHWGSEYQDYPSEEQKQIAEYLSSLGVTIVIGNHPHVIEPIEKIDNTLVFYSLGNFITAQTGIDKLVGMMANVLIKKEVIGDSKTIHVTNIGVTLTYTSYNSKFRDFKIIPFDQLDASVLLNKDKIYDKKVGLLKTYGVEFET